MSRFSVINGILLLLVMNINTCIAQQYAGVKTCEGCHQQQVSLWRASHHALAMQHASEQTVLADFSGTSFTHNGVTTRFYKKNSRFMVRTDGPDGKLHDYEIKYSFGVSPLQQYLVAMDNGRLQALTIAWDTRPVVDGGQQWFHLYPDESITYKDELHWTRSNFNWNGMCAECHSTNLKKNYDSTTDTFSTQWSEINVSCEACHGPASEHISRTHEQPGREKSNADNGLIVQLDERKGVNWIIDSKTGNASRSEPRKSEKEIEVCAPCHSRRSAIADNFQPGKAFTDHYMPRLLDEDMYFSDGQIEDEVYVYGSFLQSKMYRHGVTCSDCHDPHSLQLRAEGNAVCLQCHAADKFNTTEHHHHKKGSAGAQCAECHMPPRSYMVVDPRHDHSFRIPRPDLSASLGTPDACTNCHRDRNAQWASSALKKWKSGSNRGFQQFAEALDAGRNEKAGADKLLLAVIRDIQTPDIARASALSLMPTYFDQTNIDIVKVALKDKSVMLRMAAVGALESLPVQYRVKLAFPMLTDNSRAVRIAAARILASLPAGDMEPEQKNILQKALAEYIESQQVNADRPEAQVNLGNFYVAQQQYKNAEAHYRNAIRLDGSYIPARINLADLYRLQDDNAAALKELEEAKDRSPGNAAVHYALGLALIRMQQGERAITELESAASLEPENVTYSYVYAIALNSMNRTEQAIKIMQDAHERFPDNREILQALVAFHRDAGNEFAATTFINKGVGDK